jgi:hypothetical protein
MEISENERTCNYFIWTRRPIYNCSSISRVFRASLIPINRHLALEEKETSFEEESNATSMRFFIVFIFFLFLYYFLMRMIFIQFICN